MTPFTNTSGDAPDPRERMYAANRSYAEQFHNPGAPRQPSEHVFVLTCMDARIDPLRLLGLDLGAAHVMRNAGGRVSDDAMRSLVLSSVLLDTRHVMVIHHTDCGLGGTSDHALREDLRRRGVDVGNLWTGAFGDLDDSVREDVETLRSHPLIGGWITVTGHVYDVATGQLRSVDGAGDAAADGAADAAADGAVDGGVDGAAEGADDLSADPGANAADMAAEAGNDTGAHSSLIR